MELDTTPCPSCINNASPSAIFHQNSSQRRFDNSLMSVATLFAGVCRPLSSSPQEAERALLSRGSLHPEPEYPSKLTSSRSLASSCRGNAKVSSLLADSNTWSYRLEVVQHPQKTADFGSASLSRLPLTPPIVVQLIVKDPSGNSIIPEVELPFLIAHLSLFSADGQRQLDMGSAPGGDLSPPILYGNLVSSVHQLEDLQGNMGMFFLFPDVSIRYRGQFRLRVNLMRLMDQTGRMSITPEGSVLAYATTGPFDVVAYNEYSAVPPTRLTQWLLRQGARLSTHMSNPNP
ncbi:hypothetical protein EYR36_009809 [Pleurotus pulmonarius]|nr:hypothetical protein EYR36_009809 [Pleurotus pulmonarius]